jgi:Type IV secretory pathway, VirB4 components
MVVYDIQKLGAGMKPLGLYISLNDIWNKMISNSKKGIHTWIYIDEFYILLQLESSANFLKQLWKTARKWKGVPTGITQNVEDLLNSTATRDIINNTNFILMMSLSKQDRGNMTDIVQIPASQLEEFCDKQPKGHGLIYTGDTTLPFDLTIPKDTRIFDFINTSHSNTYQ